MKFRRGLTLVDLMIALAVMAIVFTALYSVFAFQSKTLEAAQEGSELFGQGLVIMDRLTRDIQGAWLPATGVKSGVSYRFKGEKDRIDLAGTARISPRRHTGSELAETGYRLAEQEGDGLLVLLRRQDDTVDEDPLSGGREFIVCKNISEFEFVYLSADGVESDSWSSEYATELPRAVRIRMVLAAGERKETFINLATIPLSQPVVRIIKSSEGMTLPF